MWTDEKISALKEMWKEGLSGSQIGLRLGASRCAVIAKIHRLGLSCRTKTPHAHHVRVKRNSAGGWRGLGFANPTKKAEKTVSELWADTRVRPPVFETPAELRKDISSLENGECRFPFGDGPFQFCARKSVPGISYCPEHAQACLAPAVLRKHQDSIIEKIAKQMEPA